MNKTLQILAILTLAFLLPLVTSLLLDWHWITAHWSRQFLVILLMAVELAICVILLRLVIKTINFKR